MTAQGATEWVHQYGWVLPKITEAQRAFGVHLDELLAHPDIEAFRSAVRQFSSTIDEARSVPPLPGREESRLFREALEGWSAACGAWLTGGLPSDAMQRGMSSWQAATAAYGKLGQRISQPSHGLQAVGQLWNAPKEAAREARPGSTPDRRVALLDGPDVVTIDLHAASVHAGSAGFFFATFFGVAAWVPVIASLAGGGGIPVAGEVVLGVLGTALLAPVVFFSIGQFRMRRATDRLRIGPVQISRTGQFVDFDVRWEHLRGVSVILAAAFRGQTSRVPARLFHRMRPSRIAIEFVPLDPQRFAHAYPVLSVGPAHAQFAELGGEFGCDLGVCTQPAIRKVIAALHQTAPRQWMGVRPPSRR